MEQVLKFGDQYKRLRCGASEAGEGGLHDEADRFVATGPGV